MRFAMRQGKIGIDPSNEAKLFCLIGPVGAYFKSGFRAISLMANSRFVRAFPGGTGGYKLGWYYLSCF